MRIQDLRLMGKFDETDGLLPLTESQKAGVDNFLRALDRGEVKVEEIERCPCGSAESYRFAAMDRYGLPFGAHLCLRCGLAYTNPRIATESLPAFYENHYYPIFFSKPPDPKGHIYKHGQGEKVFGILECRLKSPNVRVLDIGAGTGSVLKEFATAAGSHGIKTVGLGVEYNTALVQGFDNRGMELEMRSGSLSAVGREDGPFNVVIMSHVLEHLPQPGSDLDKLLTLCAPGALVYIEVPGILSLRMRKNYRADVLCFLACAHLFHFTLISLAHLLNSHGFSLLWGNEVVESIFTPGARRVEIEGNAGRVRDYLDDLETSRAYYQGQLELAERIDERLVALERRIIGLDRALRRIVPALADRLEALARPARLSEPFVLLPRSIPWSRFLSVLSKASLIYPSARPAVLEPNPAHLLSYGDDVAVIPYQGGRLRAEEMWRQLDEAVDWGRCAAVILPVSTSVDSPLPELQRFAEGLSRFPDIAVERLAP